MSKKLTIFDFPQNTQLRLHQKSDAKTKHSYLPSITNSNNLFGPFKQQDATSPPFLLPLDVMYSNSRREQSAIQTAPESRIGFVRSRIDTVDQISFTKNSFSCEFNGRKLKNDDAMLNLLTRDRLGYDWLVAKERGGGHGWCSTLFSQVTELFHWRRVGLGSCRKWITNRTTRKHRYKRCLILNGNMLLSLLDSENPFDI